jgi:hypothetical protein
MKIAGETTRRVSASQFVVPNERREAYVRVGLYRLLGGHAAGAASTETQDAIAHGANVTYATDIVPMLVDALLNRSQIGGCAKDISNPQLQIRRGTAGG